MSTQQKPIDSGFNSASTTSDVLKGISLSGKTAIVTGGYAGLGLETTKSLAKAGAKVIVPVRDKEKALENLAGIPNVEIELMDLMNPISIERFSELFLASKRSLNILVNNAGIMWAPLTRDSRGFESHLSTNHLGHFHLTALLLPALKNANGARVVNVSSWGHRFSPFVFEDYNFKERPYEGLLAYGQSKTANNLFALEIDRRGQQFGIRSFSLHPGSIVDTDLKRYASSDLIKKTGAYDENGNPVHDPARGFKTVEQGAATQVWCATSPQLQGIGGVYCENCNVAEVVMADRLNEFKTADATRLTGVMPHSIDPVSAHRLWELSEELIFNGKSDFCKRTIL